MACADAHTRARVGCTDKVHAWEHRRKDGLHRCTHECKDAINEERPQRSKLKPLHH